MWACGQLALLRHFGGGGKWGGGGKDTTVDMNRTKSLGSKIGGTRKLFKNRKGTLF